MNKEIKDVKKRITFGENALGSRRKDSEAVYERLVFDKKYLEFLLSVKEEMKVIEMFENALTIEITPVNEAFDYSKLKDKSLGEQISIFENHLTKVRKNALDRECQKALTEWFLENLDMEFLEEVKSKKKAKQGGV